MGHAGPYLDVLRQTEQIAVSSSYLVFQVRYKNKIYGVASGSIVKIFGLREKMHGALLTPGWVMSYIREAIITTGRHRLHKARAPCK